MNKSFDTCKRGRLNRPVTLIPWANLYGIHASEITLPQGTNVHLVSGMSGTSGDGWVVTDVELLKRLTGNPHDPVYRYVTVDAADVEVL